MKKVLSIILAAVLCFGCISVAAFAEDYEYPFKTEDGTVRDPYVLVYEGKYYLYATCLADEGYACVVSEDLENWSAPIQVFTPYDGFDGDGCYWAPECHYYNGSFYLFATYHSKVTGYRGTAVFRSDSPTGPFELISDGHITPKEYDCIDGTLYVDDDGQPWMVYVNEWTSTESGRGEMAIAKLSDDLSEFISEPIVLFAARDPMWAKSFVTDGPFMYRTSSGQLIMLWSNEARNGYSVGVAISDNGEIDGNWSHQPFTLYTKNIINEYSGGHPMIFTDLEGNLTMLIHSPNSSDENVHETATFLKLEDIGYTVVISADNYSGIKYYLQSITNKFVEVYYSFMNQIKMYLNGFLSLIK